MTKETITVEFTENELRRLMRIYAVATADHKDASRIEDANKLFDKLQKAQMELNANFINEHFPPE